MTIFNIFSVIFATIATCNGAGTGGDPFLQGFNAPCAFSYDTGCKIGQQKYGEGAYDAATEVLGGYLSYVQGSAAGLACALCDSGFFGDGNKTQGDGGDREAECCPNTAPQCGNNPFQRAYTDVHPVSCELGYDSGKGKVDQYSLIILGGYFGILLCGTEGLLECSSIIPRGIADQIPAEIANLLKRTF